MDIALFPAGRDDINLPGLIHPFAAGPDICSHPLSRVRARHNSALGIHDGARQQSVRTRSPVEVTHYVSPGLRSLLAALSARQHIQSEGILRNFFSVGLSLA